MTSSTDQDALSHSGSPLSASEQTGDGPSDGHVKSESQDSGEPGKKPTKDPKDPSRPRRKKARRACHACQRAHLTCGDERPCQRCIKRGLADQCCDGVRKKAKYLHDTPSEAFLPGGMSHYNYINTLGQPKRGSQEVPFNLTSPASEVFNQLPSQTGTYPVYRQPASPSQAVPEGVMASQQYVPPTPTGLTQFSSPQGQQNMQTLLDAAQQSFPAEQTQPVQDGFGTQFFDANDLSKFNFDPTAFNFGNHYGALEFGMLGHMATGAAETPPSDSGTQYNQNFASPVGVGFADSPMRGRSFSMNQEQPMPDWQAPNGGDRVRADGTAHIGTSMDPRSHIQRQRRLPAAIPINVSHTRDGLGRLTGTLTPPATDLPPSQISAGRMTPNTTSHEQFEPGSTHPSPQLTRLSGATANGRLQDQQSSTTNTVSVYDSITQSYDYVASWHHLKTYVLKRFKHADLMRIAKALASIRPSFIAATRSLQQVDLLHQEKYFQRTLLMYEDFMADMCLPTLICRRTGEIVAVSDEFCTLTDWSRDVLLGKEANLNENYGYRDASEAGSGTASATALGTDGSSRGGMNTPRVAESMIDSSKPRELYLAEVLDDKDVVEYYEDFARMAFGEPRGRVTTRMLLYKYRTKADMANSITNSKAEGKDHTAVKMPNDPSNDENFVDCACRWTVKRDNFEFPMMIVLNFLPILQA